ncbi:MAG: SCP2 sterol-binding domain-containing protein [Candidatus Hodarchaeota archaeon]
MQTIPTDFIGAILHSLLERRLDSATKRKVLSWKMRVLLETDYYPLTIDFDNGYHITRDVEESYTIRVGLNMDTLIQIARGKTTLLRSVLKRRVKISGLIRHPIAALRIYSLINTALR